MLKLFFLLFQSLSVFVSSVNMASTSTSNTETDQCFICEGCLADHEVSVVKQRGVATLLASAAKRAKPEHQRLLEGVQEVAIHVACQKKYNNERLILASLRRESQTPTPTPRPTRSSNASLSFDFDNKCFLCDEMATEEYRQKQSKLSVDRRNPMIKVTLPEVANTILTYARKRGDELGKKNQRSYWHFG